MKYIGRKSLGISAGVVVVLILGTLTAWAASYIADTFTDTTKVATQDGVEVHTDVGQVTLGPWACGSMWTDSRDEQTYTTVSIGDQCWMAENLNVGTRIGGGQNMANNGVIEKYCYDNSTSNCETYGGLYQWSETMQYEASCNGTGAPPNDACAEPVQGICPDGWHIPSHYEWTTLERAVCDSGTCETDFPYDMSTTNYRGTNEGTRLKEGGSSGFESMLSGDRQTNGEFYYLGTNTYFRTSVRVDSKTWLRHIYSGSEVNRFTRGLSDGISVRCVMNSY